MGGLEQEIAISGPLLCFTASSKPVKATNQDLPEKHKAIILCSEEELFITFKGQKKGSSGTGVLGGCEASCGARNQTQVLLASEHLCSPSAVLPCSCGSGGEEH